VANNTSEDGTGKFVDVDRACRWCLARIFLLHSGGLAAILVVPFQVIVSRKFAFFGLTVVDLGLAAAAAPRRRPRRFRHGAERRTAEQ